MKQRLLAVGFGILWASLITEIGLRVLVSQGTLPNRFAEDVFVPHPNGWMLEPNLDVFVPAYRGIVNIKTNSDGFRDDEYSKPRQDDDGIRLLILGDSFTLSIETPQEEVFHRQLEDRYGDSGEVIAIGVSAYQLAQVYLAYDQIGKLYQPDTVVYMLYVGNDLIGNTERAGMPYFRLGEKHELVLENFPSKGEVDIVPVGGQTSSALMRRSMLAFVVGGIWGRPDNETALEKKDDCDYWTQVNILNPTPEQWAISEMLLLNWRDQVIADGGEFRVAVLPTEIQVEPDEWQTLQNTCPEFDGSIITSIYQRTLAFLEANDIVYLDLLPPLQAGRDAAGESMYIDSVDIHWTYSGHDVVTDALYKWLDLPE